MLSEIGEVIASLEKYKRQNSLRGVDEDRGLSKFSADGPAVCCYRKSLTNPPGDRWDRKGRAANNKSLKENTTLCVE